MRLRSIRTNLVVTAGAILTIALSVSGCSTDRAIEGNYPVFVDFDRGEVFVCRDPGNEESDPPPCLHKRGSPEYPKVHGRLVGEMLETLPHSNDTLMLSMFVSLSPENKLLAYERR